MLRISVLVYCTPLSRAACMKCLPWLQLSLHSSRSWLGLKSRDSLYTTQTLSGLMWYETVTHYLEDNRIGERTNQPTPESSRNQKWWKVGLGASNPNSQNPTCYRNVDESLKNPKALERKSLQRPKLKKK